MKDSQRERMELLWNEDFWSHPNIPLYKHLYEVGKTCKDFIIQSGVKNQKLIYVAELIGRGHDFGKYTSFFQHYIRGFKADYKLIKHSPLSALFTAWLIDRELKDNFLTFAAFICVLNHHGDLNRNISNLLEWLEDNFGGEDASKFSPNKYKKQIESLQENFNKISDDLKKIGIQEAENFLNELPSFYSKLWKLLLEFEEKREIRDSWKKYFTLLLLFSALIDADRRDAAQLKEECKRESLNSNLVDLYREKEFKIPKNPLDSLRNEIYQKTMNHINSLDIFKNARVTSPTGSGKTLLAFSIALKLRERINKQAKNLPRIIYVLPYINIIEQTYDVFSDVLKKTMEIKEDILPHLILKHHHSHFPKKLEREISLDQALLLQEAWDSEIIVTTFVQFFHGLIGGNKNFLKKFHNMYNSIIILDEVQTIPMEYWELIRKSFDEFTLHSNSIVIVMTATQPIIFDDWKELVPGYITHYKKLDRVIYSYIKKEMEVEEISNWFVSEVWKKENPNSAILVMNTISSSIEVYNSIKKFFSSNEIIGLGEKDEVMKIKDKKYIIIAYLSTNIVPIERKRRIELIKELLKNNRKVIVISTQVIEAGVDLDFDVAVRDIGPIDSLIQVAGRCNRSARKKYGKVYIIKTVKKGQTLASQVYGNLSIWVAEQILNTYPEFSEKKILEIMNKYFKEEYKRKSHEESKKILDAIKKLDFSQISEFELIKEEQKESIFIELSKEAKYALIKFKETLRELQEAMREGDLKKIFELKAVLRKSRTELEKWIVAVWNEERNRLPPEIVTEIIRDTPIWYVRENEIDEYYDKETGYKLLQHEAIL